MRTIDDIPQGEWPSSMPLHWCPTLVRLLFGCDWRFRYAGGWVYLSRKQYHYLFGTP